MKFNIQRHKWIHGTEDNSTLMDTCGNMCALGFYLKELGARDDDLLGCSTPADSFNYEDTQLLKLIEEKASWLFRDCCYENSKSSEEIIRINDSETFLTSQSREEVLKTLFYKQGVEVEFED